MKINNKALVEKLKKVNSAMDEKRLKMIFKYFIKCKHSLPFTQKSMNKIRDEYGVSMSHRHAKDVVDALATLGFKPATTEAYKKTKAGIIEQVIENSGHNLEVVTRVYENAVSQYRVGNTTLANELGDRYSNVNQHTIKNMVYRIRKLGAPVKEVKETKQLIKKTKEAKKGVISLDDGLIRWNPAKLLPEAFQHLDGVW